MVVKTFDQEVIVARELSTTQSQGVNASPNLFNSSRNTPAISIVIPTLNEAENLRHVLLHIPSWVDEVLLVDGHSMDGTVEVARQLLPSIRVMMQSGRGKGNALRCGVKAARGNIIIMLDADGSTDPAEIPFFVGALLAGADFAKGSRFLQGAGTADMPPYRIFGNFLLTALANILFKNRFTDITYGYSAFWRYCIPYLALELDGWANEIVSCIRATRNGLRVVEVACFEHKRVAGEAKLRAFSAGWTILKAMLKERFVGKVNCRVWERKTIVGDEVFTPAMQLLRYEALTLSCEREHLSPEAYQRAIEAVKATYLELLKLEPDNSGAQQLRDEMRKNINLGWGFLEHLSVTN